MVSTIYILVIPYLLKKLFFVFQQNRTEVRRIDLYDVYISQLFRFARECSNVSDVNCYVNKTKLSIS